MRDVAAPSPMIIISFNLVGIGVHENPDLDCPYNTQFSLIILN